MKITVDNYIENVLRTKSPLGTFNVNMIGGDGMNLDVLHGAIGLSTEAGELLDSVKKCLFYASPFDTVHLVEEAGDALYYIALILNSVGYSFEDAMQKNIDKLKVRYPEKFTSEHALNRDLDKERIILERR